MGGAPNTSLLELLMTLFLTSDRTVGACRDGQAIRRRDQREPGGSSRIPTGRSVPGPGGTASTATAPAAQPPVDGRGQEHFMPIANVIRIMRMILPMHAKISDDAKVTILECVLEYISFITGEANERCRREQRKTIAAGDVIWAMGKIGFHDYVGPLRRYLQRYRESEGDQRMGIRGGEHFPIVKHRRQPQITAAPSVCSQPPPMCSSILPLPPSSSLMMPPTAPPPRFNHLSGEGSGSGCTGVAMVRERANPRLHPCRTSFPRSRQVNL
ncbi:hypothetical protein COCNU_01G013770 [Cocos nucifera]|uniref:Transcription factor CBF/NF-Y/archaeal histone domain-containing protein n=1 Tax=Cocos nucifera TaxID=13894 RepID=A0A8K0HW97_COCNU|nr:hypothetical protein COCNU_01G013770 [Cocos nucifera]